MLRLEISLLALLFVAANSYAEDASTIATDDVIESELVSDDAADSNASGDNASADTQGDGIKSPKTMSGMSILGNEEAPKSLVIIPWKSSELGDTISLSDTLDERARPVDKEVFLRELSFYDIRSEK